jgi:hypothetical protein
MIILFRRPYTLPAHPRLDPRVLRSLVVEFEQQPLPRSHLSWAQSGQLFVTVLAVGGLIAAVFQGWVVGALMAALIVVIWFVFIWNVARAVAILLSQYFADYVAMASPDGRAVRCERCGYDLRGSTAATCPECGEAVIGHPSAAIDQPVSRGK